MKKPKLTPAQAEVLRRMSEGLPLYYRSDWDAYWAGRDGPEIKGGTAPALIACGYVELSFREGTLWNYRLTPAGRAALEEWDAKSI